MFVPDPRKYPALAASHQLTQNLIERLRGELARRADALSGVCLVAASGSVGRGEAHAGSDLDCLVVLDTEGLAAGGKHPAVAAVLEAGQSCGLSLPKADGIFRQAVTRAQLLEAGARGRLDEMPSVYGKRMQCLLDTVALYAPERMDLLRRDLLKWYAVGQPGSQPMGLLLSELMRYLHSYRVWQLSDAQRDAPFTRAVRLTKLGASRLLTIAAMVLLLGECAARGERALSDIEPLLALTPLSRLAWVMNERDPTGFARLLAAYETVHARLAGPTRSASPLPEHSLQRADGTLPGEVQQALATLSSVLSGFVLERRGDWPTWVMQRVLF